MKTSRDLAYEWYRSVKAGASCITCPEDDPVVLEFHHLNPADKCGNLSHMVRRGEPTYKLKEEFAKGVLVCANCHKKVHAGKLEIAF